MWILGPVLFSVLVGSSVSGTSGLNITAQPGDDVTLPYKDPNINEDLVFKWTRSDLQKDEYMFFYRSDGPFLEYQHESFQNRVSLKDPQMKDGNLSVVLENVTINDTGIYQCRVLKGLSADQTPLISTIHLSVSPPGEEGGQEGGGDDGGKDGDSRGRHGLIVLPVLLAVLVLAVVVLLVLWIYKKKKGSNQSSRGSNKHQNPEIDHLNSERNTANI